MASAEPIHTTVAGLNGLSCEVYLNLPDSGAKLPLVVHFDGSGIYTTRDLSRVDVVWPDLLKKNKVAVLTIDKPGIRADETQPSGYQIDAIYRQHTTHDLIECGYKAILWAAAQTRVDLKSGIFLRGHSEGALIAPRVYEKLLTLKKEYANSVKAVLLSGIPMDSMRSVIHYQASFLPTQDRDQLLNAIQKRDSDWLHQNAGESITWFDSAFSEEPLSQTLDHIATLSPHAVFEFYQGLKDQNVNPSSVQAYEVKNKSDRKDGKPAILLGARYYSNGHGLNYEAASDLKSFVEFILNGGTPYLPQ